jgi:hypothetical protein
MYAETKLWRQAVDQRWTHLQCPLSFRQAIQQKIPQYFQLIIQRRLLQLVQHTSLAHIRVKHLQNTQHCLQLQHQQNVWTVVHFVTICNWLVSAIHRTQPYEKKCIYFVQIHAMLVSMKLCGLRKHLHSVSHRNLLRLRLAGQLQLLPQELQAFHQRFA